MKSTLRWLVGIALGLGAFIVLPFLISSRPFYLDVMTLSVIFAFAACGWNLIGGYQNQLALGHAAYFAIGAYSSSLLFVDYGVSPWLGLLTGFAVAAVVAAIIAAICMRLKGAFYALATVALAEVVRISLITARDTTGGAAGLTLPYSPSLGNMIFEDRIWYAYLFGAFLVLAVVGTELLARSRWGRQSVALSIDEDAARSLGVNVWRLKTSWAALSGGLTAMAGTFYAQYLLYITPDRTAGLDLSIEIPLIAVLGGLARSWGPVLGAALLIPGVAILRSQLADLGLGQVGPAISGLMYGLLLVILLMALPKGIGPTLQRLWRNRTAKRKGEAHTHA